MRSNCILWAFLLHRITGLGVLLFLAIHIIDTSFVYFVPELYDDVIALYRSTLFGLGEIALVFCLFFHGINGVRLAITDLYKPTGWQELSQQRATLIVLVLTLILWIPSTFLMARNLLIHNFGLFGG